LPPERVGWNIATSPTGKLVVGMTEKGEICRIGFLHRNVVSKILAGWRKKWPQTEFYQRQKSAINIQNLANVPVLLIGTPFQCAVWKALAKIPFGQTRAYGDIMGPCKARAVGAACGANPVPYLIPCHRVVAAKGLGGFSGGLEVKKTLLKTENSLIF